MKFSCAFLFKLGLSLETADFQGTALNAFDKFTGQQKNTRARR
jgi:hypothetical protein